MCQPSPISLARSYEILSHKVPSWQVCPLHKQFWRSASPQLSFLSIKQKHSISKGAWPYLNVTKEICEVIFNLK